MSSKFGAFGVLLIKLMCGVMIFFSFVFTLYAIGPALETKYFPVVSKLEILSIEPTADGQTKIKVAFRKLRDCEYVGLSWFVGKRLDDFERVSVVLMRPPGDTSSPNRPIGTQKAGPWVLGIPIADVRNNSFAQLAHRCHPFWTTITEFYP